MSTTLLDPKLLGEFWFGSFVVGSPDETYATMTTQQLATNSETVAANELDDAEPTETFQTLAALEGQGVTKVSTTPNNTHRPQELRAAGPPPAHFGTCALCPFRHVRAHLRLPKMRRWLYTTRKSFDSRTTHAPRRSRSRSSTRRASTPSIGSYSPPSASSSRSRGSPKPR